MYQFFVEPEQIDVAGKSVIIRGNDVNHIKNVLRMKPGEEVLVVSDERLITAASIIDYAVPLVTAVVFLLVSMLCRLPDLLTALVTGCGLVLGFFLSGIAGRRFARGRKLIEIRRNGGCPGESEVG